MGSVLVGLNESIEASKGTLLSNILFRLADCEHPLPPAPSGAASLRSPVDRRGTHPQQVGGGPANVPADLQGKVGKALAGHALRDPAGYPVAGPLGDNPL